jgi:hypothetical protein
MRFVRSHTLRVVTTRPFVLRKLYGVPERPRIIAGQVAHPLRSAFDRLAYELLIREGINDPKRLRECAFPIITNRNISKPDDRKKHDAHRCAPALCH